MQTKMTPMMKQYLDIKKEHASEILFFRMGDFYEMFFEDANTASKILDIALTSRNNDVPMCGLPYHAAESYIARLIKAGKRVAICEQMEQVPSSGTIVKREVIRIITPGTVVESNLLQSDDNNFLSSIIIGGERIGMAFVDISTGDFFLSSIDKSLDLFRGELTRFSPREIVLRDSDDPNDEAFRSFIKNRDISLYKIHDWYYDTEYLSGIICDVFALANIKGLGIESDIEILAAGAILQYLKDTHKKAFSHIKIPQRMVSSDFMVLDDATISNLEIVKNQHDGSKQRTLFSVLNHTGTAMGRRFLEHCMLQPMTGREGIEKRLDIVQYFYEFHSLTDRTREILKGISDMERLVSRFIIGKTFPRDYIQLRNSLTAAMEVKKLLMDQPQELLHAMAKTIPDTGDLTEQIHNTISDDSALTPEQGRVIREGFNSELDTLYALKKDSKTWVLQYEETEKTRLGIPTLRVKYNKIVGYYIEVSKGQTSKVPESYYRKQTLVGAERYTTDALQRFEQDILSSSDRIVTMELAELEALHRAVLGKKDAIQKTAAVLGELDFYCSLAVAAVQNRYIRPVFNGEGRTILTGGRHPIVERYYTEEVFIPNDIRLDGEENIIKIITGPNMSGKSTYIRMTATIQLMAQIGSFVPADEADLSIVDRIFTRIGASDNISRGESTFLVEMNEAAIILNNATERSLIIMDEVGRGTSTYDGLSIAWAVVEYILRYIKAKTLFATHYHELTQLGEKKGIVNYNVLVKEHLNGVDFLHRVVPGSADKSYGIHVARLAGIPGQVTSRAAKILERLEKQSHKSRPAKEADSALENDQLEIFNAANHRVVQAIRNIDLDTITPLEALNELHRLKKIIE
ncbi:MAG TPA: DNA mismatch repair protein MutS [Spirochaetota bacterium]|nr:DNA mismatch repair protein MutS [Spirochaetota bacterium]